jgi:hypothetical protein
MARDICNKANTTGKIMGACLKIMTKTNPPELEKIDSARTPLNNKAINPVMNNLM